MKKPLETYVSCGENQGDQVQNDGYQFCQLGMLTSMTTLVGNSVAAHKMWIFLDLTCNDLRMKDNKVTPYLSVLDFLKSLFHKIYF